jgi:hypothetical protein
LGANHQEESGDAYTRIQVCNENSDAMITSVIIQEFINEMDCLGADYLMKDPLRSLSWAHKPHNYSTGPKIWDTSRL